MVSSKTFSNSFGRTLVVEIMCVQGHGFYYLLTLNVLSMENYTYINISNVVIKSERDKCFRMTETDLF